MAEKDDAVDDNDDDDGSSMGMMRRMLESSWNTGTMGVVPSTPTNGAEEAAAAIEHALDRDLRLLSVDLLLPSYDVGRAETYDEVAAVKFCVELAAALRLSGRATRSAIVVKTGPRARFVRDVVAGTTTRDEDGGDADVDEFRRRMAAEWDADASDTTTTTTPTTPPTDPSYYRITSMFGDDEVATAGPDVMASAVRSVDRRHGVRDLADDDTIILLSSDSLRDMVGVRRLVGRFGPTKTIILVNSKLDPVPRELSRATTVYSLLPLVARAKQKTNGGTNNDDDDATRFDETKIVLLRRFPRDWELFIDDDGTGFEFVDNVAANAVSSKGPDQQWIGSCVQQYMRFKSGKQ